MLASLAACASAERLDVAGDIRAFLVAVRDGDRPAFDEHVDRQALKTNLKSRIIAAAGKGYGVDSAPTAASILAGPLMDFGADLLVRPETFRAAASAMGYGPETRVPNAIVLTRVIRPLQSDRACVLLHGQCSFIFRKEEGVWKLIDFDGDPRTLLHLKRR